MPRKGRVLRATDARLFLAPALPVCLASLLVGGRALAAPAPTLTLPPGMFDLEINVASEPSYSDRLTLFKDFKWDDSPALTDHVFQAPALTDRERPGRLALFKDFTFADPAGRLGSLEGRFRETDARSFAEESAPFPAAASASPTRRAGLVRPLATGGIMALAVGVSLQNSLSEPSAASFHFGAEGFFGAKTYSGGADKASHFVDYTIAERLFEATYRRVGYTDGQSRWLAAGTSLAAGLATEIGDGTTLFGFSYEDLLMDALGIATAMSLSRSGWDDAFGFRYGSGVSRQPAACCATYNYGRDYSGEIYTGDVKIAGLARHFRFDPGPARFLLFSATYGTSGYRNAPSEARQRLVGIEVGIHFSEILRSLGVPGEALWGEILYLFFDSIRIPFTAIGVRYDLNHHQWFGVTAGRTLSPQTRSH